MAAHILKMSDADTIRFLEYYQNEPVLWDSRRGDYKKRECRLAAARRIAVSMDIRGFTETHVIMKFKNLRSSFSQELKKIAESRNKPIWSLGGVYVPKVAWFKLMDSFIKPYVKSRTALSNVEDPDTKCGILENIEIIEHNLYTLQDPLSTSKEEESENSEQEKRKSQDTSTVHAEKHFGIETLNENSISSCAMETSPGISKSAPDLMKEDSFDHFGKYIASLLRPMSQERSSQLQSEIVSMILMPTIKSESQHFSSYSQVSPNS